MEVSRRFILLDYPIVKRVIAQTFSPFISAS